MNKWRMFHGQSTGKYVVFNEEIPANQMKRFEFREDALNERNRLNEIIKLKNKLSKLENHETDEQIAKNIINNALMMAKRKKGCGKRIAGDQICGDHIDAEEEDFYPLCENCREQLPTEKEAGFKPIDDLFHAEAPTDEDQIKKEIDKDY